MGGDSNQTARRSGDRGDEFAGYMQGGSRPTARDAGGVTGERGAQWALTAISPNYGTMISGGRTTTTGARSTTAGCPTMSAEWLSGLAGHCRPPSEIRHPVVVKRVITLVKNRIFFIFSWYRFLEQPYAMGGDGATGG